MFLELLRLNETLRTVKMNSIQIVGLIALVIIGWWLYRSYRKEKPISEEQDRVMKKDFAPEKAKGQWETK